MDTGQVAVSRRSMALLGMNDPLVQFMTASAWARRRYEPAACDFVVGNPHEMPLPGFVEALRTWAVPRNKDWFGYTMNDPDARAAVATTLGRTRGVAVEP